MITEIQNNAPYMAYIAVQGDKQGNNTDTKLNEHIGGNRDFTAIVQNKHS